MVIAGVAVILWIGGRDCLLEPYPQVIYPLSFSMPFWLPPRQAICQSWVVNYRAPGR